jgi:hypothetical protein
VALTTDWTQGGKVRAVGVSEHTAVLMDGTTGDAFLMGDGPAYFLSFQATNGTRGVVCERGRPLSLPPVKLWRWRPEDVGAKWAFSSWSPAQAADGAAGGTTYSLSVTDGVINSTQPGGGIY